MEVVGEQLREMGWRQGVIIPAARLIKILLDGSPVSTGHELMAVSQSCDLVHRDLKKEPHAVFLLLNPRKDINLEFSHGRNPRVLHLKGPDGKCLEATAWQLYVVPREKLIELDLSEATKLPNSDLQIVTGWLAKRYTRIAFPDDFNEALRLQEGVIKKALKKKHHLFSEILMALHPFEDLDGGGPYELACYLLMPPEVHGDEAQLADARAVAAKLEEAFGKCGLEVLACNPVSEAQLTYDELKELVRWDYDHLTFRAKSEAD